MLSISACAFWPFVFLLWRNISLDLQPIFSIAVRFFVVVIVALYELLYILKIKPLVVLIICKYFLPVPIFSHVFCLWVPCFRVLNWELTEKKKEVPSFCPIMENFILIQHFRPALPITTASCGLINAEFCLGTGHLWAIFKLSAQRWCQVRPKRRWRGQNPEPSTSL